MYLSNSSKGRFLLIFTLVLVGSVLLASCGPVRNIIAQATPTATLIPTPTPIVTPTLIPTPTSPPLPPAPTLGVEGDPQTTYPGIPWVRIGYPTCGNGNLSGSLLKSTILHYHDQGIRVLLTICQQSTGPSLFDPAPLNDVAQGGADAVQCGNEEMKYDPPYTRYIAPADFARYFDLCEHAMHAVRPNIPVLLGSLDPHVGGIDYGPLASQVDYLNAMQYAMNTEVHPGGNWNWRTQTLGLIDSWHNGYPSTNTNSLYWLFVFWAQQFNVDLNSGALGKHIWVVEGTGCYKGCGIDPTNPYQVAVSHILTLITDVQTTLTYKVPFFYFSGKDIPSSDGVAPFGIDDINGHPKPLRQDLPMGARSLTMSCSKGQDTIVNQEQLLADLYRNCTLPGNYFDILVS